MNVEVAFAEVAGCAVTGVTWPREREAMNETSWALKASEFWMMRRGRGSPSCDVRELPI